MEMVFRSVAEAAPGPKWRALFEEHWPSYRQWFLSEGIEERPTYAQGLAKLKRHMPELLPTYERLCELSGGLDLQARFLGLYRPPAYLTGCSQVVWPGDEPVLIRNYDYSPGLCEGLVLLSRWNGRAVLAMVDCLWGVLDGINDAGLAISLTFGGRFVYAVRVDTSGGFLLCPADVCALPDDDQGFEFCPADGAKEAEAHPMFELLDGFAHPLHAKMEQFLADNGIEVAGIEMITDRDGKTWVYDVNTNTNYNPDAEETAGVAGTGRSGMGALAAFLGRELQALSMPAAAD